MAYSRDYPNSIIPKGSKVVECLQNDDKELKRILGILSDIGVMSLFGSKRQCVLHAATGTDGKPSYITANGLNVVIDGSTTPVIVTFAGGYNANGTVDKTDTIVDTVNAWTMPANGTYYLYIDKDMSTGILSYGYTTIPDTYATTAPESPTLDQCYFNTVDMKMYHYNSSAWEQKLRVFVAKAVTTADTATLTIYPFTSRTTASNFIQYDGNGNLQAVDLAGALTQLSASKFIGTFKGDIVGNADTATKALAADKCTGNADTATKATNDKNGADIAATYLPKSGGTMSGNLTVPTIYSNTWFRSQGDTGWYSDNHGGGWYMTNSDWVRSYNGKGVYTAGKMQADSGFYGALHGIADAATNAAYVDNDNTHMRFHWAGQSGQPTWLWGGNDPANSYVYNPSNFSVAHAVNADNATKATHAGTADTATNAGTVNGWNVDSFKRNLGGRNQPSLTALIDWTQTTLTINSSSYGCIGTSGHDIHLKQSWQNFDKILIVMWHSEGRLRHNVLWEKWELAQIFSTTGMVSISKDLDIPYYFYGYNQAGTAHPVSTDTLWKFHQSNSYIQEIYGVNY